MQRIKSAVVAALFLTIPVPAAAQHWSFDARRIALGGVGLGQPCFRVGRRSARLQGHRVAARSVPVVGQPRPVQEPR